MRDKGVRAVYLKLNEDLQVTASEITIDELFNTDRPNDQLRFDFETRYEPYERYAFDNIGGIDLVVKHNADKTPSGWRRPLEVKLTVIPDGKTSTAPEAEWSPELVIRPASTKYCAMGIYNACQGRRNDIREIFQDPCGTFQLWNSLHELRDKRTELLAALNQFQKELHANQQPFLLQPIWKTKGKSPILAENAFDLFVWSDFALCRTFIDGANGRVDTQRCMRASARFARMLYVLSTEGRANLKSIYTEMAYGLQTDKEFALPGQATRKYLDTPRRVVPQLKREIAAEIILNGGEKILSPERRFDATIYFTTDEMFAVRRAAREAAAETDRGS